MSWCISAIDGRTPGYAPVCHLPLDLRSVHSGSVILVAYNTWLWTPTPNVNDVCSLSTSIKFVYAYRAAIRLNERHLQRAATYTGCRRGGRRLARLLFYAIPPATSFIIVLLLPPGDGDEPADRQPSSSAALRTIADHATILPRRDRNIRWHEQPFCYLCLVVLSWTTPPGSHAVVRSRL